MKDKGLEIISYLRKNARESLTNISKKTNIPISTIFDRLKIFEKDLIVKHTSLLNFSKLGYETCANMVIKISNEHRKDIAEYLIKHSNVNSLSKITNGYDYMFEVFFKNLSDFQKFNEELEDKFKIEDMRYYFVLNNIKREEFMSDVNIPII